MKIAFDIDDTLLVPSVATGFDRDTPNYENIAIFKWFKAQGYAVGVWSGSGVDYAKTWAEKLGLHPDFVYVKEKRDDIDIAFDDCVVDLARVNVRVKRLNNGISRKEWNETETTAEELADPKREKDPLFDRAVAVVKKCYEKEDGITVLSLKGALYQEDISVSYARASALFEQLQEAGIISRPERGKAAKVL